MANPVKFTLEIDMGNDAMRDEMGVASALRKVADIIPFGTQSRVIMDINGNPVGKWDFTNE